MAEYIEREALIADIDAAMDNAGMGRVVGQTLKRYVKRYPVADVALVVRAKWNDVGYKLQCSLCNHTVFLGTKCMCVHDEEKQLFKYCPHCGAKMEGEADA